ncbi:hypothetical protein B0H14DRAFT_3668231 [Mycena olivaceomarginata]|nr:hypothetical protein B0H14DRAFT_3668231 [Mycena olivaceomarginata]
MAETIPDELILEILSPGLRVPEATFSDTASISPAAALARSSRPRNAMHDSDPVKSTVSSSAVLLVCKAWLRVATPLLYHVIVIRSKAQARALEAALHDNPDLGKFIRRLRLEGGFGASMQKILNHAGNITDIFISLEIHASDSTAGLAYGLSCINPTRLILADKGERGNKQVMKLLDSLMKCATTWTKLTTISFPYASCGDKRNEFIKALCARPTLKAVSFPYLWPGMLPFFLSIAENSALEAIEIRFKPPVEMMPSISHEKLAPLLRWAEAQ